MTDKPFQKWKKGCILSFVGKPNDILVSNYYRERGVFDVGTRGKFIGLSGDRQYYKIVKPDGTEFKKIDTQEDVVLDGLEGEWVLLNEFGCKHNCPNCVDRCDLWEGE